MYNRTYDKANKIRQKLLLFIDNELLSNQKYSKISNVVDSFKICFDETFSHNNLSNYNKCNINSSNSTTPSINTNFNFPPSLIKRNKCKNNTYNKKTNNNEVTNVKKTNKTKTLNQNMFMERIIEMNNNKYVVKFKSSNSKTILVEQKKNKDCAFLSELCDKLKKRKRNDKSKNNKKHSGICRNKSNLTTIQKKTKIIETKLNFEKLRKTYKKTSIDYNHNFLNLQNEKIINQ